MYACVYICTSIWRDCWSIFDSTHFSNDQTSDLYLSNGPLIEPPIFQHPHNSLRPHICIHLFVNVFYRFFLLVHYTLSLFPLFFSPSLPPSLVSLSLQPPVFSLISNFWLFLSQFLDRLKQGSINLSIIRQQNSLR